MSKTVSYSVVCSCIIHKYLKLIGVNRYKYTTDMTQRHCSKNNGNCSTIDFTEVFTLSAVYINIIIICFMHFKEMHIKYYLPIKNISVL